MLPSHCYLLVRSKIGFLQVPFSHKIAREWIVDSGQEFSVLLSLYPMLFLLQVSSVRSLGFLVSFTLRHFEVISGSVTAAQSDLACALEAPGSCSALLRAGEGADQGHWRACL